MESVYPLMKRNEIIARMNFLGNLSEKFLFIVDFHAESGYVISESELNSDFICFSVPGFKFLRQDTSETNVKEITWNVFPVIFEEYSKKFRQVQKEIQKGNSFLVNLTQPTQIKTELNLPEIFQISRAKYKLWLKDNFVVFSPETFVKIENGTISSYPMKGTIDANIPNARELILNDQKEMAEHATIVDLIRNDLSMVADNVKVDRYRYVENILTNKGELLQVSSCITGELPIKYQHLLGNIIFSMLPAGSISGAPKPKTIEIIDKAENYNRGFYTGVFGWYDGKKLDSAVMIRFIEQQGDNFVFKSGGGITSQSDAESEYNELIQKIYVPVS